MQIRQGDAEAARATIAGCLEQLERWESWPDLLLAYRIFFLIAYGQSRWSEARTLTFPVVVKPAALRTEKTLQRTTTRPSGAIQAQATATVAL